MQDQYKIYLVYIILSILCILCIILVSIYSTGSQIADWILGSISVLIFMGMSLIIYRWEKEKKELRKMKKEMKDDINKMKLIKELTIEPEDLPRKPQKEEELIKEGLEVKTNFDKNISEFILSLLNMKTLENEIYLKQYNEYKFNLEQNLKKLNFNINPRNKDVLKELINDNIYKDTINKYNTEIDENKNNINQLFNHFINYFIEMFDKEPYNLETLADNLIKNLQKLQTVILSMKDNISYKIQFNTLIKQACNNSKLIYPYDLKTRLTALKIDYETLIGKGEVSGKGDSKIMQCLNLIKSKLIPIDELDTLKTRSYNNLINITNDYYIHKKIDWHKYVTNIKPLFNKFEENEILNWIKTCIIPNNN